jgi:hypothetical protein
MNAEYLIWNKYEGQTVKITDFLICERQHVFKENNKIVIFKVIATTPMFIVVYDLVEDRVRIEALDFFADNYPIIEIGIDPLCDIDLD